MKGATEHLEASSADRRVPLFVLISPVFSTRGKEESRCSLFVCQLLTVFIFLFFTCRQTRTCARTHMYTLLRVENKEKPFKEIWTRSLRRPLKGALPRPTSAYSISVTAGAASTELSAQEPPGLFVLQIFYYRYFLRLREHALSFQDRSWPLVISWSVPMLFLDPKRFAGEGRRACPRSLELALLFNWSSTPPPLLLPECREI